ncbi:unnamed protein product, partial [Sphenostylis stenocarpa]
VKAQSKAAKLHSLGMLSHLELGLVSDAVSETSALFEAWEYRWTTMTKLELDDSVLFDPKRKTG